MTGVTFKNSHSDLHGGVIYIDILDGELSINSSSFVNFSAPYTGLGSMLYSVASNTKFLLTSTLVQCKDSYDATAVATSLADKTSNYAGAIYFKNSI